MGQFVGGDRGHGRGLPRARLPGRLAAMCSLYNETNGVAIPPTPAIGGIGLIPDIAEMATHRAEAGGDALILIGREGAISASRSIWSW